MPISRAPYKRSYYHRPGRGRERRIICSGCGREVPRYKTFVLKRQFRITDPGILQQVDRRLIHTMTRIDRFCPSCARFRGISQPGKSERRKLR
ncbi:MAG: hypothetical protein QXO27_03970 [Candidatus Aenigmatarchaeota archaeon]